jgi:hypothetical protein
MPLEAPFAAGGYPRFFAPNAMLTKALRAARGTADRRNLPQDGHHGSRTLRIGLSGWFVGDQEARLVGEGARDRHPLPLSTTRS